MTSKSYKQTPDWILSNPNIADRIKIDGIEYARLKTPAQFSFSTETIKTLKNAYEPSQEKGGLVYFQVIENEKQLKYNAIQVKLVTNIADDKKHTYRPDPIELNDAYKEALSKKNLPFFFHTHPTINEDDNIMMQGMNFLNQLNTSIADQSLTRRSFKYNGVEIRLPDLLVVENANALFIGMYGGLIAPLCFTEQKKEAINSSMEKTMESLTEMINTPERKTIAIFSAFALIFLAFKYPKAIIPTAIGAGVILPPMMYANREKHDYFGVTFGTTLTIHVDKLTDQEIINFEIKANEHEKKLKELRLKQKQNENFKNI